MSRSLEDLGHVLHACGDSDCRICPGGLAFCTLCKRGECEFWNDAGEMIACDGCKLCAGDTRVCALCGIVVCRHTARKQRTEDGKESIVCKEPFDGCLKRVGRAVRGECVT